MNGLATLGRNSALQEKNRLPANSPVPAEPVFTAVAASADHIFWLKEICEVTLASALARGTGISVCAPVLP